VKNEDASGLVPGETLARNAGYTVDSAAFDSDSAGERTVTLDVLLLPNNDIAKNYELTNGESYVLQNQRIEKAAPDTLLHLAFARDSVVIYDGQPHVITVSLKKPYTGMDSIVVKYNDTTALPVNVGKYAVTIDLRNNVNFSDSTGLLLDTLTIVPDAIAIDTAFIAQKIYDGANIAIVDSVQFKGFLASKNFTAEYYTVDSAFFNDADADTVKTVTAYVSLSDKAKNYVLENRKRELQNQTIEPSPQKILFPKTDTTIYVNDGDYTLRAIDSTGGAPPLPVLFRLTTADAADAKLDNDSLLKPLQPGTVYVTAYIEPNPNYANADTVRRKFIITDTIKVTVTFSTGDVATSFKDTVAKADTVGKPKDPVGSGLIFGGWYADEGYKTEWRFSEYRVTQDTTLYARWGYTVRFSANGGKLNSKRDTVVINGGTVAEPADPEQRGYDFKGWYTDSILYAHKWDFSGDTIRHDTTLYAKWDTVKYSIIYHLNASNGKNHVDNPDTFTVLTPDITLQPAAMMGDSIFDGWYNAETNGSKVTEIRQGSIGNRELWAKWRYKRYCPNVPNVNCPDFPYYDSSAHVPPYYFDNGGGGADDNGDDTPNINDTSSTHYHEDGGGGDTSYCGHNVQNTQCPDFPGYKEPGGGGYGKDDYEHLIRVTYADSTFKVATTEIIPPGDSTRWFVLNEIATIEAVAKDTGEVHIKRVGSAYIMGYLPKKNEEKYSRVVMRTPLWVMPRQLFSTPDFPTVKPYDRSDTVPGGVKKLELGELRNLVLKDTNAYKSGLFTVTDTARYDSTEVGSNRKITVKYALQGSFEYSHNYYAPADTVILGKITLRPLWVEETVPRVKVYDGSDSVSSIRIDSLHNVLEGDSIVLFSATASYSDAAVGKNKLIVADYIVGGDPDKLKYYERMWRDTVHPDGEITISAYNNPDSADFWECPLGGGCDDDGDSIPNINDPDSESSNNFYESGGGGDTSYCGKGIPNIRCPKYPYYDSIGGGGATNYCGDSIRNLSCPSYPGFYQPGGGGYDDDGDSIPNINDPDWEHYDDLGGGGDTSYCGKGIPNISCPSYPYYDSIGGGGATSYCGDSVLNLNCPTYPGFYQPGGGGADDNGDGIPNINDPDWEHYYDLGGGGDTSYCGKGIPNISCPEYPYFDSIGGGGATGYCGDSVLNISCPAYPGYNQPGGGGYDDDGDGIPNINDPDWEHYDDLGGGGDTTYCGNGIPNVNCPGYPGYYLPGGGGDTGYCGNGIPNISCPDAPHYPLPGGGGSTGYCGGDTLNLSCPSYPGYYQPGGGGDTGYCGNGILNVECPLYPGYYEPGGGGGDGRIRDSLITITYADTSFWIVPDSNAIGGSKFEWVSLTPKVATTSKAGMVSVAGCGRASILCFTLPDSAANEQKNNRVVATVTLDVAPKPLAIVDTWVDTIKTYDAEPDAGVVAGVLQGVLERDAGSVSVQATAKYNSAFPGSGKPIVVTYTLTGSRAYCYVAPPGTSCSGSIVMDGKHSDIWGVVMKRDEANGAARPYADVNVAYTVKNATTKTALTDTACTDADGRYFIGGLGYGDTVTLRPEEKRTWMVTPLPQPITVKSNVEQVDTLTYAPDNISLRALTLRDDDDNDSGGDEDSDVLAQWKYEEINDTTYYELPCNRSVVTLSVEYAMPANVTGRLVSDEADEAGVSVQRDDNLISVDVSKPGRKVFTIELSSTKRYTVVLDKPYGLFDFVTEHLGYIRTVVNNPEVNGGFSFTSCTWWYKKDSTENWETKSGTQFYYTAGPNISYKFSDKDTMYVILYTTTGDTLTTCPDDLQSRRTALAAVGSKSEEDIDSYAYPNPVRGGSKIYLKRSIIIDGESDGADADANKVRYSTYRLFNSIGKLVFSGSASVLTDGLTMPKTPGAYFLILDGKAGRRVIRIAVF
jgi:uncharacterized repeat protein (TIGR02543 family)